jgi:hypothetical protein
VPIVLKNLGTSTSWNPQGLSRLVMGLLYLYLYPGYESSTHHSFVLHFQTIIVHFFTDMHPKVGKAPKLQAVSPFKTETIKKIISNMIYVICPSAVISH